MDASLNQETDQLLGQLSAEAEQGGYHLNPQTADTKELIAGLLINEKRYGYRACPCREATGSKEEDLDIICPCDYRDPDLYDYDTCFCGLYVSERVLTGEKKVLPIPERRPADTVQPQPVPDDPSVPPGKLKYPVWRCKVCGYLCAREHPPGTCPICRAAKERFEKIIL